MKRDEKGRKGNYFTVILSLFIPPFFLSLPFIPLAFSAEAPSVRTSVWPKRAAVGDEIQLFLRVASPERFTVAPPPKEARLSPFELKKIERLPPVVRNRHVIETYKLTLTVFELGELTIPSLAIDFSGAAGSGRILSTPVKIQVVPVAKHPEKSDTLKPIKDPVSLDMRRMREVLLAVVAALLSSVLAFKVIRRRLRQKRINLEGLKSPHERALGELDRLRRRSLLREGKVKEFYSELADILRRYFSRRYGVETLERTTAEIMVELRGKGLVKTVLDKAGRMLGSADLVKFAKFIPDVSLAETLEKELIQIIELTKPEESKPETERKK